VFTYPLTSPKLPLHRPISGPPPPPPTNLLRHPPPPLPTSNLLPCRPPDQSFTLTPPPSTPPDPPPPPFLISSSPCLSLFNCEPSGPVLLPRPRFKLSSSSVSYLTFEFSAALMTTPGLAAFLGNSNLDSLLLVDLRFFLMSFPPKDVGGQRLSGSCPSFFFSVNPRLGDTSMRCTS